MKQKFIILFLMTFILTGCTVNYSLNVSTDKITENVNISGLKDSIGSGGLEVLKNDKVPISIKKNVYYDSKYTDNGKKVTVNYKYKHNLENFENSYFISKCYDKSDVSLEDNILKISTEGNFKCYNMYSNVDEINITITSKMKVLDNNADEVKDNNYMWHITKNNYQDKAITMKMVTTSALDGLSYATKSMIVITVLITVTGLLIFVFVRRKQHKNNSL